MLGAIHYLPRPLLGLIAHTTRVGADIDAVTQYDPRDEVDPGSVGLTDKQVEAVWRAVKRLYATGMQPGISFVMRRHGQVVLKRAIGFSSGNGPGDEATEPVPMTPDTPICLFSTSKAFAAMLVHLLSERNLVSLLDPISHYLPEFGRNGKQDISIYQLLCHKAGIASIEVEKQKDVFELLLDQEAIRERLYDMAPENPGHHHAYHALSSGFIIGALVERVTGISLRRFLRENVSKPLRMKFLDFGARPSVIPRIARNYVTGFRPDAPTDVYVRRVIGASLRNAIDISNDPRFYRSVIPAGNMVATADDCSRFFQCLLNGGELDGIRVFSPLTVRRATVEVGKSQIDRSLLVPIRYSAGMMLGGGRLSLFGPDAPATFGHLGLTCNLAWADRERDISVTMLTTGKPLIGGMHLPMLIAFLYSISKHCPKISDATGSKRRSPVAA